MIRFIINNNINKIYIINLICLVKSMCLTTLQNRLKRQGYLDILPIHDELAGTI
jgi:hypothetical protein